jgi:NADPH:quinone reductase-like Zn-dependent oxidoreductase
MTAVGGPEVLEVADLPDPEITGNHDVLVRLRAAGINPVDYKLRQYGTFGNTVPAILGWDGAGVVDSTGPAVTRVRPGDEVYFCDGGFGPTPGTYAELKVVDERYLARKPERLSFAEAAAAPLVTITALHERNLRASFTWMPAPSVFGWPEQRERQRSILEQAAVPFDAGDLRVQVGATFPLAQAADAHRALETGQVIGKAVLTMD